MLKLFLTIKKTKKRLLVLEYENDQLTFQLQGIQKIDKYFLENFIDSVFWFLLPKKKIHIESAERFGISLFYREMDFAKNEMVEILQKMETNKKSKFSPSLDFLFLLVLLLLFEYEKFLYQLKRLRFFLVLNC